MINLDRCVFIAWAPHGRRSESLARELGAKLYFIHYLKFKNRFYAPFKYVLQAFKTLQVLITERPKLIFVQNPPFICGITVDLFCRFSGSRFVLDHHSAAFAHIWDWALPIQKVLARRAVANIVTNQHWAETIRSWSANPLILIDPLPSPPEGDEFEVNSKFGVVYINTFSDDEPIDAVLDAAAQLPDVHFYITGDTKRKLDSFFENLPPNVTFTGFLPDAKYYSLLRAVQAVMTLTTRDFTLQGSGYEAIALGKPLITSDWDYLQKLFAKGTVYVANSAEGIRDGVKVMQEKYRMLEQEMIDFRETGKQNWSAHFSELTKMIANS